MLGVVGLHPWIQDDGGRGLEGSLRTITVDAANNQLTENCEIILCTAEAEASIRAIKSNG